MAYAYVIISPRVRILLWHSAPSWSVESSGGKGRVLP
jgi:hypothetical protein